MRRKWNRFVAGLLSIVLLVTMLPMEVLAAGNGGRAEQPSQTMPFQDVKSSDWCAKAVEYVQRHVRHDFYTKRHHDARDVRDGAWAHGWCKSR